MKYIAGIFALMGLLLANGAQAKSVGVGAVLGSPTGFSVNLFLNQAQTVHTIAAWDLDDDEEDLLLASHYTWRRNDFAEKALGWFYGAGARLQLLDDNHRDNRERDDFELGPSATTGLFYELNPVEFFLKGNLTVNIVEETDAEADLMVGAHYNF